VIQIARIECSCSERLRVPSCAVSQGVRKLPSSRRLRISTAQISTIGSEVPKRSSGAMAPVTIQYPQPQLRFFPCLLKRSSEIMFLERLFVVERFTNMNASIGSVFAFARRLCRLDDLRQPIAASCFAIIGAVLFLYGSWRITRRYCKRRRVTTSPTLSGSVDALAAAQRRRWRHDEDRGKLTRRSGEYVGDAHARSAGR